MNKQFIIDPLVSVGEIKFGMERGKVRGILGEYSEYRNQQEDINTADCFKICQVFYNENNAVEFIMFHVLDKVELIWDKKFLTKMTKLEIIDFFSELDENLFIENYGYGIIGIESNLLGIACYFVKDISSDADGNEIEVDKVETISIAVKNYWK